MVTPSIWSGVRSSSTSGLHVDRQDDVADAGTLGGKELLLDAADRQHVAAERDLAGHGEQRTHRPVGAAGETSAVAMVTPALGPSLGMRSGGHVDVEVDVLE